MLFSYLLSELYTNRNHNLIMMYSIEGADGPQILTFLCLGSREQPQPDVVASLQDRLYSNGWEIQ